MAKSTKTQRQAETKVSLIRKLLLLLYCLFLWIIATLLILVTIWAWYAKGFFNNLKDLTAVPWLDPVLFLCVIGVIMFILSSFGLLGALTEKTMLLVIFFDGLKILFFIQHACMLFFIIALFGFKSWFYENAKHILLKTIINYRDDPDLQNLIDVVQQALNCCGVVEPNDWDYNIYFNCSSEVEVNGIVYKPAESCGVPFSCCESDEAWFLSDGDDNKKWNDENAADFSLEDEISILSAAQSNGPFYHNVVNTQCGYNSRLGNKNVNHNDPFDQEIFTDGCLPQAEKWVFNNQKLLFFYVIIGILVYLFPLLTTRKLIDQIYDKKDLIDKIEQDNKISKRQRKDIRKFKMEQLKDRRRQDELIRETIRREHQKIREADLLLQNKLGVGTGNSRSSGLLIGQRGEYVTYGSRKMTLSMV